MKKILKAMCVAILCIAAAAAMLLAMLYFTLCGGHPHGVC
ncbi:hypothetical protein AVAK2825_01915 [Acidovorax sp. SUPP2825]|nr:hypothetical protein AVAK2825_01915 [Acidovorax sp. SUPP2825]